MVGERHCLTIRPTTDPWPLVVEIARATPPGSWALVGGMMVHVHAVRAGLTPVRPTRDVDLLLDIGVASVGTVAGALAGPGFTPADGTRGAPLHRFRRDADVVDLLVARDVSVPTRWRRRPLLRSPGAAQALKRLDSYILGSGDDAVAVQVPDPLGAIIAKAAAHAVDSRRPQRHLEDLVVLASAAGSPARLDVDTLSVKDRRHLDHVLPLLLDRRHPAWAVLEPYDREIGLRVWQRLAGA